MSPKFDKVDDYSVALTTSIVDSLLPYEIAVYYQNIQLCRDQTEQ
jgi:hypothetical protein